jgi:organic radical activating enzyme
MRDYKCDQKFSYLKLNVEKKTLNSCCDADHEDIDAEWLKNNPGKIFNTKKLHSERIDMLSNKRIKGCERACWKIEDKGLQSRRISQNSEKIKNADIDAKVKRLDLAMSFECNLACTYCCREYSSSWREDLLKNGDYKHLEHHGARYKSSNIDKILRKVSQVKKKELSIYELINKEIKLMDKSVLEHVSISGGEPFLYHNLINLLKEFETVKKIRLYTGLGFSENIFKKNIDQIKSHKNVELVISAESTGTNFEYNRNGAKWNDFIQKIDILRTLGIKFSFHMTYSNLNVIDYVNFQNYFKDDNKDLYFVIEPNFMNVNVLDNKTKEFIINQINKSNLSNTKNSQRIIDFIKQPYSEKQRIDLKNFLQQYNERKKTNLSFMPDDFHCWLND